MKLARYGNEALEREGFKQASRLLQAEEQILFVLVCIYINQSTDKYYPSNYLYDLTHSRKEPNTFSTTNKDVDNRCLKNA